MFVPSLSWQNVDFQYKMTNEWGPSLLLSQF